MVDPLVQAQMKQYDEALSLQLGESVREPSRWNTLRAMRVLRWYENA